MRRRFVAVAAAGAAYFVVPGHPDLPSHGVPLGPIGTVLVAAILVLAVVFRRAQLPRRTFVVALTTVAAAAVLRALVSAGVPPSGWNARYFANADASGPPEWSSDFRRDDITRIDRAISFHDDTFPAHYLNDYQFDRGDRREVTEPMTIDWTGHAAVEWARDVRVSLSARGAASMRIDGQTVAEANAHTTVARTERTVTLTPGPHALEVRYVKPRNTDGLIDVKADLFVSTRPIASAPAPLRLRLAYAVDAFVLLVVFGCAWQAAKFGSLTTDDRVAAMLSLLFGLQGAWQAKHFAGRVVPFIGGDDWFGFESCAREIQRHGLLMPMGKPLGEGIPYFFHPFYCYFLAAVHAITGESLFGPVFVQFLILAAVATVVWRFVREEFDAWPAAAALVATVLVFELDFVRYYTVTLLSENLYFLTVTLTLVSFGRWMRAARRGDLVWTGVWAGVSTITRPPMLLFLPLAMALVAIRSRSLSSVALLVTVWLAVVAPITARNLVVSHRFVLVSDVPIVSVFTYNIPPSVSASHYGALFRGTGRSIVHMLGLMTWEHPVDMLAFQFRKLGFSLGMIQWGSAEYRPHPELVAVSALYIAMLVLSARLRQPEFWPMHAFVVCHLASMSMTMPWNYGYRLVLPPYVYTTALSVAAAVTLSRRSATAPVPQERPI